MIRRPDYIYSAGVIETCRRNFWKEHVNNWRRKEEKAYRELNDILLPLGGVFKSSFTS